MKRILCISIIFLFFSFVQALTNADVEFIAYNVSSDYIHANQDMYIHVDNNTFTNTLTINIADIVVITASFEAGTTDWQIKKGSNELRLDSTNVISQDNKWIVKYVIRDNRSFLQNSLYQVTIDVGDGNHYNTTVTFNKQYVLRQLTMNANSKYQEQINGGNNWFKAGLSNISHSDANLQITGMITYRYEDEVFPSSHVPVSLMLFISNNLSSVVNVNNQGKFSFNNFALPNNFNSALKISVNIDDLTNQLFSLDDSINTLFTIGLDNSLPNPESTALMYMDEGYNEEGILPISGYFSNTRITFNLSPHNYSDPYSGVSNNIYVVNPIDSSTGFYTRKADSFVVDFSHNGIPLQGPRDLVVRLFDNVYNFITVSVRVTIDAEAPEDFVVSILPDVNNFSGQSTPDLGWYNHQAVSFSWNIPNDTYGLREYAYQFKSEGWSTWSAIVTEDIVLYASQNLLQGRVTVDVGDDSPKKIWVRAIDKAGNTKESYATVKVDTKPPTVSIVLAPDLTGREGSLISIFPRQGWYNDANVKWLIRAEDDGQLQNKAYSYRYYFGTANIATSSWQDIIQDIIVTSSERPTGNIFKVMARDKAGNIGIATAQVFVDFSSPQVNNFRISFDPDEISSSGVTPEVNWYSKTTVSFTVTWDQIIENGQADRVLVYIDQNANPHEIILTENSTFIRFENITVNPRNATPINFKTLLVDKAGNFSEKNKAIFSDITSPNDFTIVLADDSDSNDDGLEPLSGYYDNPAISFILMLAQADPTARNRPFQFRVNNNQWGEPTSNMYINNFMVSENTKNFVDVRYKDKAGNVMIKSFSVTVDTVIPSGTFSLLLNDCGYIPGNQVTPDSGWYNKNSVSFRFAVSFGVTISDNLELRDNSFLLRKENDAYYNIATNNSQNALINLDNMGALKINIIGAIADKAGNIIFASSNVYVDTQPPFADFHVNILPDSDFGDNGIWPVVGWHAKTKISFSWDQANDGAGSLHAVPYRIRSDLTKNWTIFQSHRNFSNLLVSTNIVTQNLYIQVRDKAGNLSTRSVQFQFDNIPPVATLFVSPQVALQGSTYDVFYDEYQVKFPLEGWQNTTSVILTWNISDNGAFPTESFKVKASKGQTFYSPSLNHQQRFSQLEVSVNNLNPINLYLKAWDMAGNSSITTTEIRVDQELPQVTVNLRSQSGRNLMPFVNSQDILFITFNISKPISVTPFIYYAYNASSDLKVTINNIQGSNDVWFASLNIHDTTLYGDYYFIIKLVDDAGNIANKINGYNKFVKLPSGEIPLPVDFQIIDMSTGSSNLTGSDIVEVSFRTGLSINKYVILEYEVSSQDIYLVTFNSLVSGTHYSINTNNEKECSFNYQFANDHITGNNRLRSLYLWVRTDSLISNEALTASIVQDMSAPKVIIYANKESQTFNSILSKTKYVAEMTITHNIPFVGDAYFEKPLITPDWTLKLFREGGGFITYNIFSPTLSAEVSKDNDLYRTKWWAEYDLVELLKDEGGTYFDGLFEVRVTDMAGNVATEIFKGSTFNVDTQSPQPPILFLEAIDGRTQYTNTLNIICHISKNFQIDEYYYYRAFDNYSAPPRISELISWEQENFSAKPSFSFVYKIEDTSQGTKDIYAWVANNTLQSSLFPTIKSIVYDSLPPTYHIDIQSLNEAMSEVIITIFFNEKLDTNPIPLAYLENYNGTEFQFKEQSPLVFVGKFDNNFCYTTTFNKSNFGSTSEDMQNSFISINVSDLAGNFLFSRTSVFGVLEVFNYDNYFARAYRSAIIGREDFRYNNLRIGKKNVPVMAIDIKAEARDIHLQGLNLSLHNVAENDIEKMYIYLGENGDGLFDKSNDELLKEMIFQGHTTSFSVTFNEILVDSQTTKTIFLVVDVNSLASKKSYIGFGVSIKDQFILDYYEIIDNKESLGGDGIIATFDIVSAKYNVIYKEPLDEGLSVTSDIHSGQRVPIKKFSLRSDLADAVGDGGMIGDGAKWTDISLKINSNFSSDKISRIAIYKDNGNYYFDEGDLLLSSGQDNFLSPGQLTVNLVFPFPVFIGGNESEFFIVVDTDRTLGIGNSFSFEIVSKNYFKFQDGDEILQNNIFPIKTITFNVDYYVSQITVDVIKNEKDYVYQGESINALKMELLVDYKAINELPRLYSIDIEKDQGSINLTDINLSKVKLFNYAEDIEDEDFSYGTQLGFNATQLGSDSIRLSIGGGYLLNEDNRLALVLSFKDDAVVGREGTFKIKLTNESTGEGFVNFDKYGEIVNEIIVTTSKIKILNKLQPTKPEITGNIFSSMDKKIIFYYSVTVNFNQQGVEKLFIQVNDVFAERIIHEITMNVNVVNSKNIVNEKVDLSLSRILTNNTTYQISLKAKTGGDNHWSLTGNFTFSTDFTPPRTGTDKKLNIFPKWDQNRHDLIWEKFIEDESIIQYYILEIMKGESDRWVHFSTINALENIQGNIVEKYNLDVEYNIPYKYRVKAVNIVGLSSQYIDSGEKIMKMNTSEIISNISNYPNPFYATFQDTKIVFSLNQEVEVTITIYDPLGHFVKKFNNDQIKKEKETEGVGYYCYVDWDGKNEAGQVVSKGGYFAVIEVAPYAKGKDSVKVIRMIGVIH
jgi:hypothetical protein